MSETFVLAWGQVELDGRRGASPSDLRAGATLSWTGEAFRLDGPPGPLLLGGGHEAAREGAARRLTPLPSPPA